MFCKITHPVSQKVLGSKIQLANNFYLRLKGFMFDSKVEHKDGILFEGSTGIHTCFMRFRLDVLFLDKNFKVRKIYQGLKPWRMTRFDWKTYWILELPENSLGDFIQEGDFLEVEYV